ncbi:hypothetical protein [Caldisphaera sp.]|jgi:hypothetical protein|uniref:hypothetical protein n=1 Tax=Caldisphaera sp. TaxID=2060322 RepID=UPI002686B7D1
MAINLRITLSWEYCDICKRRVATSNCRIDNKEFIRVCPYCKTLLSDIIDCGDKTAKKYQRRSTIKNSKGINETLLENIDRYLKNTKRS